MEFRRAGCARKAPPPPPAGITHHTADIPLASCVHAVQASSAAALYLLSPQCSCIAFQHRFKLDQAHRPVHQPVLQAQWQVAYQPLNTSTGPHPVPAQQYRRTAVQDNSSTGQQQYRIAEQDNSSTGQQQYRTAAWNRLCCLCKQHMR